MSKKIDLGQTIGILANIGVIAGIVFLAVELRQNNALMEADARRAAFENGREFADNIALSPSLAGILAKTSQDQPLSEAERIQVYGLGLSVLRSFQFDYLERQRGLLADEDQYVQTMRAVFHANRLNYLLDETWETAKPQFDAGFVRFFEENVVSQ